MSSIEVIFVCTGNTCRSPMAAALMENALHKAGLNHIQVQSAGINAFMGAPASKGAISAMANRGIDIGRHMATPLNDLDVEQDALLLTMTQNHLNTVKLGLPYNPSYTIAQYAGKNFDINDPFGGDEKEYERTAAQLEALIDTIVKRLGDHYAG